MRQVMGAVLIVLGLVSIARADDRPSTSAPGRDERLRITVVGRFADLVLTDPKGRINRMTPDGTEVTFPGCFRMEFPDQHPIPPDMDYAQIRITPPVLGSYRLTMKASGEDSARVEAAWLWPRGGSTDYEYVSSRSDSSIECRIQLRRVRDPKSRESRFKVRVIPGD